MRWAVMAALAGCLAAAELSPDEYLGYVKYLASPEMRGRANGSPELDKAAEYIAGHFRQFGLQPFNSGSYFQDFEVTTSAQLGRRNTFEYTEAGKRKTLGEGADFVPLNMSSSGEFSGPLVFAGYGITAPEYNYDDYAGLDVKDKIVLVLRHEPQESNEHSVFAGKSYTAHAQLANKAVNAKLHGARALLLVNDVAAHPNRNDALEKFGTTDGPANAGIGFAQVKAKDAEEWISAAGKNLNQIEEDIDKTLKPESFTLPVTITLDVDIRREVKTDHNVGAYLPGETAEYVIIGAHYDHLGLGGEFSLAPSMTGKVHPGADDNASGTAGVLTLAHWFSTQTKHKRGILFLTFAGEELGLLGSNYYANHPVRPLADAVAMINLDMIGRIRGSKIYVGGSGSGTTFGRLLEEADSAYGFTEDLSEKGGYGSSDHTSFTAKQVPVLFFFSGLHSDYHRPGDTWDKINAPQAVRLLSMIADIMGQLEDSPNRPQFVRVAEPHAHGEEAAGGGSGYGPDFGSIPDFTELPNGVRFADVRPGSPAAKAGLKGGDILVEFDGKPIQNLYDFTYALRAKKPGQEVLVKVLRGNQTIEARVLLTERK